MPRVRLRRSYSKQTRNIRRDLSEKRLRRRKPMQSKNGGSSRKPTPWS